jgi:hypothetical protein
LVETKVLRALAFKLSYYLLNRFSITAKITIGTRSGEVKCNECKNHPINPEWIIAGDTCLLRLYGIPIGQRFDGVHHGHEVADLRYQDVLLNNGQQVNLGIHVKSRSAHCRPQGMGRKSRKIEGLYKQVVYSAFEAAILGEDIQVIGVAIPNSIKADVVDSMAYALNTLGFTFLVIDYNDWEAIVRIAYEQSVFDYVP